MGVNRVRLIKDRPDGFVENLGNGLSRRFDFQRNRWVYSIKHTATVPVMVEYVEDDPMQMLRVVKFNIACSLRQLACELEVFE